ncbi:MAG: YggS family pyridoxal phosphate-dependent enzyme [Gammaproteobacteria bacterium]|nr:YggS family pyridoxal phosphate-dependent enzyme [Gammaproteobacteria bacterium]
MDCNQRIESVNAAIRHAERRADRTPGCVRLVAVSKARTASEIANAHAAGQRDFGENYLQEAVVKIKALAELDIVWHFIGAIQSNKTTDIARHFQWIHTVDRPKIANRLDQAAERPLDVCIQVNVDDEPQKAGVSARDLPALVDHVLALPRLRLRGLMAIPRAGGDRRASFRELRSLFDDLGADAGDHWDSLSMGMSEDFETAIDEGATMVRIGTAIFGPRSAAFRDRVTA